MLIRSEMQLLISVCLFSMNILVLYFSRSLAVKSNECLHCRRTRMARKNLHSFQGTNQWTCIRRIRHWTWRVCMAVYISQIARNFFHSNQWYICILFLARCWSNGIGRNGNRMQTINLDPGCWGKGTVVHEIGQFMSCALLCRHVSFTHLSWMLHMITLDITEKQLEKIQLTYYHHHHYHYNNYHQHHLYNFHHNCHYYHCIYYFYCNSYVAYIIYRPCFGFLARTIQTRPR